jgi:hypothetical protein
MRGVSDRSKRRKNYAMEGAHRGRGECSGGGDDLSQFQLVPVPRSWATGGGGG